MRLRLFLTALALIITPLVAATSPTETPAKPAVVMQRGILVYGDGNRLTGTLIRESGQPEHFVSDRFGDIRFRPEEARFEAEREDEASIAFKGKTQQMLESRAPQPIAAATPSSPSQTIVENTSKVTEPPPSAIDPWRVRLNGFIDQTNDNGVNRREYNAGLRIERNTPGNNLSLDNRYEYTERNQLIDRRRATSRGDWRHDLTPRVFTLYTPYAEYDGKNFATSRNDYLLTQQQAGLGYRLLITQGLDSRVAATWSYFYYEDFDLETASEFTAPSLIFENTFRLPWELELRQKGQLYYLPNDEVFGWENEVDFTKRISRMLSLTLRHQNRRDYPALGVNPINRLRLLFGLDF